MTIFIIEYSPFCFDFFCLTSKHCSQGHCFAYNIMLYSSVRVRDPALHSHKTIVYFYIPFICILSKLLRGRGLSRRGSKGFLLFTLLGPVLGPTQPQEELSPGM
jgi:hypothetical protein